MLRQPRWPVYAYVISYESDIQHSTVDLLAAVAATTSTPLSGILTTLSGYNYIVLYIFSVGNGSSSNFDVFILHKFNSSGSSNNVNV